MTKLFSVLFTLLVGTAVFAADGGTGATSWVTPGLSMAIAAGICGFSQGQAIKSACEGIARNPNAAGNIRTTMIIGLALIESLALYTLVVVFVKG
jgi:F-type H+-transporting ATPase subunit c